MLVSHGHFDHVADALAIARMTEAPLWAPAGLAQSPGVLGVVPANLASRMNKSGTVMPIGPGLKDRRLRPAQDRD